MKKVSWKSTMKKLLLLDADIIMDLHTLDLFEKVRNVYDIYITKTVLDEAKYFKKDGERFEINLTNEVNIIEDINIENLNRVHENAKDAMLQMDLGEATSIAYLIETDEDIKFCTCDKAAITLVSFMNLDEKCISLENAFLEVGQNRTLYPRHWDSYLKESVSKGKELRLYNLVLT